MQGEATASWPVQQGFLISTCHCVLQSADCANAVRTHCMQAAATAVRPAQQGFLQSTPPVCQQAVTARAAALMAHKLTYTGVEVFAELVTEEDLKSASTAVGSSVIGRCCWQCVQL